MGETSIPSDPEQRNIIDKLAEFVARNGKGFETLTLEKQRDNPKFKFLHSGEYHDYYLQKVQEFLQSNCEQKFDQEKFNNNSNVYNTGSMNDQGYPPGQWNQYNDGLDKWHHYNVPQSGSGWNVSDPSWYQKPYACGQPYQQNQHIPPAQTNYPYRFPQDCPENYCNRNYGNQVHYGYPGYQGHYPNQYYGHGEDSYGDYKNTYNYQPSGGYKLSETDIEQSENNLKAQHESLKTQEVHEILVLVSQKREDFVRKLGESLNVSWEQMGEEIQPLIEACTKENISKGKTWVVEKMAESEDLTKLMSEYLITRSSAQNSTFELRLHLVYLINDLLHHCKRRGSSAHLEKTMHTVVPILFCLASELANNEQKEKINRVLNLWESNSYLPPDVLAKMRPPEMQKFIADWKDEEVKPYETEIKQIKTNIQSQYATLESQHQEFADHVRRQLAFSRFDNSVEHKSDYPYDYRQHNQRSDGYWDSYNSGMNDMHYPDHKGNNQDDNYHMQNYHSAKHHGGYSGANDGAGGEWSDSYPNYDQDMCQSHSAYHDSYYDMEGDADTHSSYSASSYDRGKYDNYSRDYNRNDQSSRDNRDMRQRAHRSTRPSRFSSVDGRRSDDDVRSNASRDNLRDNAPVEPRTTFNKSFFKPPEGELANQSAENFDKNPHCPSWQLPAALMYNLIALKDFDFVPLDEKNLHLMPPNVPGESLLIAVENFYMPPTPERIRDGEGWERLNLNEFYAKKEDARDYFDKLNEKNYSHNKGGAGRRPRRKSTESGISTPSDDGLALEYSQPFSKSSSTQNVPEYLSYLTAYPKSAIGQPIRTGSEALKMVQPPVHCMQPGMMMNVQRPQLTTNTSDSAAASTSLPLPPGFPTSNFLQFPPPLPPPGFPSNAKQPSSFQKNINSQSGANVSTDRVSTSVRRSRSNSRSNSRSKSRSRSRSYSQDSRDSRSRSRSLSRRSRSFSRSDSRSGSRGSRSMSNSSRTDANDFNSDRAYSRNRRRNRSHSSSASDSPSARFTSAAGPGGFIASHENGNKYNNNKNNNNGNFNKNRFNNKNSNVKGNRAGDMSGASSGNSWSYSNRNNNNNSYNQRGNGNARPYNYSQQSQQQQMTYGSRPYGRGGQSNLGKGSYGGSGGGGAPYPPMHGNANRGMNNSNVGGSNFGYAPRGNNPNRMENRYHPQPRTFQRR